MPAVLALLAAGLALRLLYLVTPGLDSDQAIFGLMAMHVLRGELPIFQWGYHYMGTIESFVAAPLMVLFGPTRFALNLSPVLFSMLFAVASYRFAREAAGRTAALWALAFACFPPIYLVWTAVVARGAYVETLALGTLAAYGALRAANAEQAREERDALLLTGLALGLSFWTHLNTVVYGGAIALFWLIERPRLLLRAIVWAGPPFLLASGPFWYGTILAHFDTFLVAAPPSPRFARRLHRLFSYRLPIVLGIHFDGGTRPTVPVLGWLLLPIQLTALGAVAWLARPAEPQRRRRAARLLLLIAAMLLAVYLASPFSGADTQRYLMPLYTLLVIAPALLVERLRAAAAGRIAAGVGLALLALQAVPAVRGAKALDPVELARYRAEREQERRLFRALDDLGLRAVYADRYWDGARFTFDARERIVFANAFEDRRPEYLDQADGAERAAFLFHQPDGAAAFEGTLGLASARYEKRLVEGFTLYYDISAPPRGGAELPVLAAGASDNPIDTGLALDRDAATRWTSLVPQRRGMWFLADLGAEREIAEVVLWPRFAADLPRGLRVEVSSDQRSWRTVAEAKEYWGPCSWASGRPLPAYDGWVVARFAPQRARFVRLVQLGAERRYSWSIAELIVRAPASAAAAATDATWAGGGRVLADPVLAARADGAVRHWQGRLLLQYEHLRDASLVGPSDRLVASPTDAITAGGDPRIGALAGTVVPLERDVLVGGLRLETDSLARRAAEVRFDAGAERAVVDLGAETTLAGVVVAHGEGMAGFARGLSARTSADGVAWSEVTALAPRPSRLLWSHEGLVGASLSERIFLLPAPVRARYVEITAAPRHPQFPWLARRVTALLAPGS